MFTDHYSLKGINITISNQAFIWLTKTDFKLVNGKRCLITLIDTSSFLPLRQCTLIFVCYLNYAAILKFMLSYDVPFLCSKIIRARLIVAAYDDVFSQFLDVT